MPASKRLAQRAPRRSRWPSNVPHGTLVPPTSQLTAGILSSLAFAAHHVVVVWAFVPASERLWVLIGSAAVFGAGAIWAWQYQQTGRLLAPWTSHVLADIAVLGIGWQLI